MASTNQRVKGITIEIGGETTKLQSALKGVNSSIKATQSSLKDVNNLLKLDPSNTTLLAQKQELLQKAVSDTKEKLEKEKEALKQLKEADQTPEVVERQKALEREIISTEQYLKKAEADLKSFGSVGSQQIAAVGTKMQETGDKISQVGTSLSKVSAGIVAIGAASVAAFKEVDDGLDNIAIKTGASGKALAEMENIAEDLATTLPESITDISNAVGEVNTRFGVTGTELKNLSSDFVKFASLNNTDVSTSIDNVQKVMSAFNIDTKDTSKVLDMLNAVGQKTGISMDTLSTSLVSNAAALQEMGLSASDAATFLGQCEVSGTDTTTVMAGLKKALTVASTSGKSLSSVLEEFQSTVDSGASKTEVLSKACETFGNKAGTAIGNACYNGSLSLDTLSTSLDDTAGSVLNTYETTLDGADSMETAMNSLKIALSKVGESIGETLAPILEKVSDKLNKFADAWENISPGVQKAIIAVMAVIASIGPLLVVGGKLYAGIGKIMQFAPKLVPVLNAVKVAIAGLTGPMIAVIAVIAVLVAAFVHLWKTNEEFRNNIIGIWEQIKSTFEGFTQGIVDELNRLGFNFKDITDVIKAIWEGLCSVLAPLFTGVFQQIANVFQLVTSLILNVLHIFVSIFTGDWKGAWEGVKGIFVSIWNFLVATLKNVFNVINELTKGKLGEIVGAFANIAKQALTWGKDLIDNFVKGIENGLGKVKDTVKKLANIVKDFIGFSEPKEGPLSNFHTFAPDMVDLWTKTLNSSMPQLEASVNQMANTISAGTQDVNVSLDENSIYSAVQSGASNASITIQIGERELARSLKNMGVSFG